MPLTPTTRRSITQYLRNPQHALTEDELDRVARVYYDTSTNLWASVERNGTIRHVNPTWERVTGFSLTESVRLHLQDLFIEDAGKADEILNQLTWEDYRGGQRLNLVRKSGATLVVGVRGEKFDEYGMAHIRLIDMSIRAAMDEELRLARAELAHQAALCAAIVENCPMMITLNESNGRYFYVSPASQQVLLVAPGVLNGRNAFTLIHPNDIEIVKAVFERMLTQPGTARTMSVRLLSGKALENPQAVAGDRDYTLIESTGVNLLDDPNVKAFITYTQAWRNPTAIGGGGRNGDDEEFDSGDDEDTPARWRGP